MSSLKAFSALRYNTSNPHAASMDTYHNIISSLEGEHEASRNSASVILDMLVEKDTYRLENRGIWIHEQGNPEQYKTGIIALRETKVSQEALQMVEEHLAATKMADRLITGEAITCAYYPSAGLLQCINEIKKTSPTFSLTSGGIRHRFWKISDPQQLFALQTAFSFIPQVILLEGRDKLTRAISRGASDILTYYIPYYDMEISSPLLILPCQGKENIDALFKAIRPHYRIVELNRGENYCSKKEKGIGLFIRGKWHKLISKSAMADRDHIPAQISLEEKLIRPFFQHKERKYQLRDQTISIEKQMEAFKGSICFSLMDIDSATLLTMASSGRLFPAGSIHITPRLNPGLFLLFNEQPKESFAIAE